MRRDPWAQRGLQCLSWGERKRNINHDLQVRLGDFLRLDARRTRGPDCVRRPLQAIRTTRVAEAVRVGAEHEIAGELAAASGPGAPVVAEPILRPCDWHGAPFGKLNAVPPDAKSRHQARHARRRLPRSRPGYPSDWGPARPRAAPALAASPDTAFEHATASGPRSSDLRVRTEFTDRGRRVFLVESFEYIARYFENSLAELQARNDRVETDFRKIDPNRFEARALVSGEERALCCIWLGGTLGAHGLYFSSNGVADGRFNESMSVSDDDYTPLLQPLGMAHLRQHDRSALTMEGAAENFRNLFVDRLR